MLPGIRRHSVAVHRDNLHSWPDPSLGGKHTLDRIPNHAIAPGQQSYRVMRVDRLSFAILGAIEFRRMLVVHQLPSTSLNSAERGARAVVRQPVRPESAPVVGSDLIQRVHYVVEGVGFHHWGPSRPSIKQLAEIVQGFLPLTVLAYNHIHP